MRTCAHRASAGILKAIDSQPSGETNSSRSRFSAPRAHFALLHFGRGAVICRRRREVAEGVQLVFHREISGDTTTVNLP